MTTFTFQPTDEQRELRAVVRNLFSSRATPERVREVMLEHHGIDEPLWRELAGMGLVGLTIPAAYGGSATGFDDLAIVVEEAGRALVPVPLLSSAVLGTSTVLASGDERAMAATLPAVADGSRRLALAHLGASGSITAPPGVVARRDGDAWVVDGRAGWVVDGASADVLVTAASSPDGLVLLLVPSSTDGVTPEPVSTLDLTRPLAHIDFEGVRLPTTARLEGDPESSLAAGLAAGAAALACEQVGGADHVLGATIAHVNARVQFGRRIGSFQAVKHRLAEDLVRLEAARSTALHAARVVAAGDDPDEIAIAVPMAKSLCSEVFETVAADGLQLHGGIGFTWEHESHMYLKRAKSSKQLLGSPRHHRRTLADALGL